MKFIGQYIQDFIARFRSDVYLEDISTGTIASGGNLGLDSNNKIVKANEPTSHDAVTLAGTPDYITISGQEITRNQIDLTADVTGTLPVGNTAAKVTSIIAGDGIDVDSATGDVTVTAETASATNPGVVELATTAETTTGTDATRAVTPDGLKDGYQGSTNVTTLGSITTGVWRGTAIDQTYLVGQSGTNTGDQTSVSGNAGTATALATARNIAGVAFDGTADISLNNNAITNGAGYTTNTGDITKITISDGSSTTDIVSGDATVQFLTGEGIDVAINALSGTVKQVTYSAEDASATNKGVVELATTAEADTGTDTARAVTPAGLKSHVDARFSYQYISFTGNATVPSDGDWITLSANGISNHSWNIDLGSGGTTIDTSVAWDDASNSSSTVTIPTNNICQGIVVPYNCVLVGYSSLIRSVGNHQSKVGLAVGVPTYNDFATYDATLVAFNAADISAGPDSNYSQRPVRADYLTANAALPAGYVIHPLIGSVASNSRTVQWNCTLVLKTLIP